MNRKILPRTFSVVLLTGAFAISPALAQQSTDKPAAEKPAAAKPKPAAKKPPPKPAAAGSDQPALLGQYGDWGAYKAAPGGKTVCFALAKPASAVTEPAGRSRDASYLFISTRPSEKVKNEISAIVGYPQKPSHDATAAIGNANYAMYTQNDGAWIKNAAEEAQMIDSMRKGSDVVIKSMSARNTKTTDTYSLKGIAQALDKVAEECK